MKVPLCTQLDPFRDSKVLAEAGEKIDSAWPHDRANLRVAKATDWMRSRTRTAASCTSVPVCQPA